METKGHCKHGEFDLREGCPDCIQEAREQRELEAEGETVLLESSEAEAIEATKQGEDLREPVAEPEQPEFAKEVKLVIARFDPEKNIVVAHLREEGKKIVKYANERTIATGEDVKDATNDLGAIAKFKKAVEEERQYYVGPLIAEKKEIDAFFKLLTDPIGEADKVTRSKILAYNAEIRRQREEAERIEAEKLRLAQEEEALTGEHTVELTEIEKPEATPERVRADMGMASKMIIWKWEVTDFSQLPDEYKVVDSAMLNATVKKNHDSKQIPGVRIYPEETLRITT